MTLLERVDALLAERGVLHALTGASALAAHGAPPATVDEELLVTDRRALEPGFWEPLGDSVVIDVRPGGDDAPFAGVVRLSQRDQAGIEIVVGRHAWQDDVLGRAVLIGGQGWPLAEAADLVLLKLFAGGSHHRPEIEQLLAGDKGPEIIEKVEARAVVLPLRSRKMWLTLRPRPSAS